MKKATLIIGGIFAAGTVFAQSSQSVSVVCSEFHVTKPVREMAAEQPADNKLNGVRESNDREHNIPQQFEFSPEKDGPAYGNDPKIIQTTPGTISNNRRAPIVAWQGQNAVSQGFVPLDPCGAAGPNNYVQMINATTFDVYSKTGTLQHGPITLGNLWSPHLTYNDGDPNVLYDKTADRWVFTQFGDNDGNNGNYVHIAVSTTGDPSGSYYTYTFTMPEFPDYVKFAVWQDGYYACANLGTAQDIFAFERTAMIAGNASSRMVYHAFTPPDKNSSWFLVPLAADCSDGTLPPAGTPCPVFSYSDNGWGGSYVDAINIFQATVNWVPSTPTMTISSNTQLPTSSFNGAYNSNWNDIIQPGTSQKLDGIGGTMMWRAQCKVWPTYTSVVVNWGVLLGSAGGQRGIMWAELRDSLGGWTIHQQGIYNPDGDTRWMGSIAMDNNGSIGISYMRSSSTLKPSLYYTGRRACDPLGTLPVTEVEAFAGVGVQPTGDSNRDGDYSETVIDPDGVTFWHTGMYFDANGNQQTRIYSYQIAPCAPTAAPVAAFSASPTSVCAGSTATFTDMSSNSPTSWSWTFTGGTPAASTSQTPTITYSTPGQYSVTLTSTNTIGSSSPVTQTNYINVIALPATPTITQNGNVLTSSSATGNQWYKSGVLIAGATNQTYTITSNGTYTDEVTANSCTSLPSNGILINHLGIITYTENNTLVIYPNPSNGQFTVSFTADTQKTYKISLYNNLGQLVYQKLVQDAVGNVSEQVDITNIAKGVYTFSLNDGRNEVARKLITY